LFHYGQWLSQTGAACYLGQVSVQASQSTIKVGEGGEATSAVADPCGLPLPARGARSRTRRAIVAAAVELLCHRPASSLGEIADAASVGRTTLHRYFPERADLLRAIGGESLDGIRQAQARARLDEGTGRDALSRLARELFDLGDLLMLVFNEPTLMAQPEWRESGATDRELSAVVERGHRDGTIDPSLPPLWVQSILWSMLYAAWSLARDSGRSRHDALGLLLRSLDGAVSPR